MQPEAVAAGLVAAQHRGVVGQAKVLPGLRDLPDEVPHVAAGHRATAVLAARPDAEGELPGSLAEFQRHDEGLSEVRIHPLGR